MVGIEERVIALEHHANDDNDNTAAAAAAVADSGNDDAATVGRGSQAETTFCDYAVENHERQQGETAEDNGGVERDDDDAMVVEDDDDGSDEQLLVNADERIINNDAQGIEQGEDKARTNDDQQVATSTTCNDDESAAAGEPQQESTANGATGQTTSDQASSSSSAVPMAAVSEPDGGEEASSPANDIIEHAIMELSKASSSASHDNEAGQSTSEYHSCPSAMMAQGALTQYSVSSKHPKINQTMETRNTSFNSSSDEESALGGVRIRGGKKAVGGRHAMTNHKRNVIAASVVSVVLVVLVGLGLGLSNKGDDDSNNNAASNGMEGLSGSIATTPVEGSSDDGQNSLFVYLEEETNNPTVPIRPTSTPSLSSNPSNSPTATPTSFPSAHPTLHPTSSPSSPPTTSTHPTLSPTSPPSISLTPTSFPSSNPSLSPTKLFLPGDLTILNEELEIYMSSGLSVKLIATTGETVKYINGQESTGRYHSMMDGAGIVPLDGDDGIEGSGGYVYVSNSEISSGDGGVYGLYFDEDGNVVDYKTLLSDTNRNCGGGITPWATWVSCEETTGGQCWQVDPDPNSVNHHTPKETLLGGDGGRYETVACDNRNPARPIFFTTEDHEYGALRRFEADTNGWDSLHTGGKTTFLRIIDDINYEWTDDESWARSSASAYYRNSEGVSYHDGKLYFAAKKTHTLFILDLQKMTYEAEYTGALFTGQGSFNAQPDQLFLGNYKRWIYFTEDGGNSPGVYVRDADGTYSTIFEAVEGGTYGGKYGESDETVGIALSPDRKKMYAGFQDGGILMEFTRDDGVPFE